MRRTPASLLRRTVMCAAGAALAVSVAGWTVSLLGIELGHSSGVTLWLGGGEFTVHTYSKVFEGDWTDGWNVEGFVEPRWRWPYGNRALGFCQQTFAPQAWRVVVPLWISAISAALVFAPAWLVERGHRRWGRLQRAGRCSSCGYDLSGITGPCPECGAKPDRKA